MPGCVRHVLCRALVPTLAVIALILSVSPLARADSAGTDPTANFPVLGQLPSACFSDGTSLDCLNVAITTLDQARASLGQPAYELPADFVSLTPAEQGFVLADLDRVLYGLPPAPGMTAALSADAMNGVVADDDPRSADPNVPVWAANWAGDYPNMLYAYAGWMYDDGPDSGNLSCTVTDSTGCWGHRHNILYEFNTEAMLAMGVAAGDDPAGTPGYAMLLGESREGSPTPAYTYTWAQAAAAGAGTSSISSAPPTPTQSPSPAPTRPAPPAPSTPAPSAPTTRKPPPVRHAPHPVLAVHAGKLSVRGRKLSFTIRIVKGSGTVHAVARCGRRTMRLAVRRSGSAFRVQGKLRRGLWKVVITYSAKAGWKAPAAKVRTVRIR